MNKLIISVVLFVVYFFAIGSLLDGLQLNENASIGGGILGALALLKFVYPKF